MDHICQAEGMCTCSIQALEPNEKCPIHGAGEWPPRCIHCGRFMKWPDHYKNIPIEEYND